MLDKFRIVCKIDNIVIENNDGLAVRYLGSYLKKKYNISLYDYVLKYYYNNIHPTCLCGCGNSVVYRKGRFNQYYKDHYNLVPKSANNKAIESLKIRNSLDNRLKRLGYGVIEIEELYDNFVNFKINFSDIEKQYAIDKRTLKSYWRELNLITNEETFRRITKRHQHFWSNKKVDKKVKIEDDLLYKVYEFLNTSTTQFTIEEIKNKFNLPVTKLVLYKRLKEHFGANEINQLIKLGNSSQPEIEFYHVLKYYFGDKIKKQFRLENKYYDYILCDKILIEFDGDYWHSLLKNKLNDIEKNKIAIRNNYIIYRIKESESKDLEHLLKLTKLYLKYK